MQTSPNSFVAGGKGKRVPFPRATKELGDVCTQANKIEAMHERSLVRVKVKLPLTSRLISTVYIMPQFYLRA